MHQSGLHIAVFFSVAWREPVGSWCHVTKDEQGFAGMNAPNKDEHSVASALYINRLRFNAPINSMSDFRDLDLIASRKPLSASNCPHCSDYVLVIHEACITSLCTALRRFM